MVLFVQMMEGWFFLFRGWRSGFFCAEDWGRLGEGGVGVTQENELV